MLKEYFDEEKYEEIKNIDNLIYKALEIVTILFKDDKDKGGFPYIIHLMSVYSSVYTEEQKVIALLHDTIEDKKVSEKDLIEIGFPKKIVDDVLMLSRIKPLEYVDYIDRIVKKGSRDAIMVKLADLKNNMDLTRIKNPTLKDYERVEKRYAPSYEKILNRLKEMEK